MEATLNNIQAPTNSSPKFSSLPFAYACANQKFIYTQGTIEPDGDSLSYSIISPSRGACSTTSNVLYNNGYSYLSPVSMNAPMKLNKVNGALSFLPTNSGQIGNFALRVDEYRQGKIIGSVVQDVQIYIKKCVNNLPVLSGIDSSNNFQLSQTCPQPIQFKLYSYDPDSGQQLTIKIINPIPGSQLTISGGLHPIISFSWSPTLSDIGTHNLVVAVYDDACPQNGYQYYAYNLNISSSLKVKLGKDTCITSNGILIKSMVLTGMAPYSYLWNTGDTTSSINVF